MVLCRATARRGKGRWFLGGGARAGKPELRKLLQGREDSVQRGQRPQDGLLWLTPADSRPRLA